jgi:multidrug efflux pump subunit AcrB
VKDTFLSKAAWTLAGKYRLVIILWVGLLAFGLLSYTSLLKKEGFPPINLPIAAVQGTYFVDDASVIDREVAQPITSAIESIENVKSYEASISDNTYGVFVTFQDEVTAEDGVREVQAAIKDQVTLPDGANNTVSGIDPSLFDNKYNLLLAVYQNQDSDYESLAQKAETVSAELQGVEGIDSTEAIPVLETVTNPATGEDVQKQTSINKIAITENGETTFYPAVSVGVVKVDSVDDLELSDAVSEALAGIELDGANTRITGDFATTIDTQIGSLQNSLIGGLVAVIVIALLLISWRVALVVALFIPTVLAAVFGGLYLLDFSLNTITLFAVILTLGLFVDDAIIIAEALDAHRRDSKKHKEIITRAIRRVGIASLAGTLTTVLVFTPMLLVSGILGTFIRLLPLTVILALSVSFIISIALVPLLARILILTKSRRRNSALDKLSILVPLEAYLSAKLSKLPLINKTDKKKGRLVTTAMVGISILAIGGAGYFAANLPLNIFPQSKDSDILQAGIEFAPNTSITEAESITDTFDQTITDTLGQELAYVTYVFANERSARLEIGLTPFKERDPTSVELIEELQQTDLVVEGATIKYSQQDAGPPAQDFPFQMRVYATNSQQLAAATEDIAAFVEQQSFDITGDTVSVANVKTSDDSTITRTAEGRFATISAQFDADNVASPAVVELERLVSEEYDEDKLASLSLKPTALDFDVSQESENADSFGSVGLGLVVAIVLMYLLLVGLFNSFLQPLLILVAVPFSLFGVFFGLTITNNPLSFFVMLGLLGLIGIVVNNSILLTEYANQERDKGADRWTAISRAVKDRFRPLVTTTITAVFALLPLALSDPFWQGLAYTLIFGLISSTTLVILSFPYYYLLVERIRDWKNDKYPNLR